MSWLVLSWDAGVEHYLQTRSCLTAEQQAAAKLSAEELVRKFVTGHVLLSQAAVSAILRYICFCLLAMVTLVISFGFCRSVIHTGGYAANEPEHVTTRFFTKAGEIIKAEYKGEDGNSVESETWHAYS